MKPESMHLSKIGYPLINLGRKFPRRNSFPVPQIFELQELIFLLESIETEPQLLRHEPVELRSPLAPVRKKVGEINVRFSLALLPAPAQSLSSAIVMSQIFLVFLFRFKATFLSVSSFHILVPVA